MNKILITLTILALLTLAACGTETTNTPDTEQCTVENGCITEEIIQEGPINTTTTTVTINITGEQ